MLQCEETRDIIASVCVTGSLTDSGGESDWKLHEPTDPSGQGDHAPSPRDVAKFWKLVAHLGQWLINLGGPDQM